MFVVVVVSVVAAVVFVVVVGSFVVVSWCLGFYVLGLRFSFRVTFLCCIYVVGCCLC